MRCYIPLLVCPLETYKPKSFFFFMVFFHFPGWKPNLPPILFRVPKLSNPCRGQLNLFLPCRSDWGQNWPPKSHVYYGTKKRTNFSNCLLLPKRKLSYPLLFSPPLFRLFASHRTAKFCPLAPSLALRHAKKSTSFQIGLAIKCKWSMDNYCFIIADLDKRNSIREERDLLI